MNLTTEQLQQIIQEELEAVLSEKEGKKDACYHKVKSRYKVWPSAYASGALVKCRKVGAKNWGNKSESLDEAEDADEFKTHMMYDPASNKKIRADKKEVHDTFAAKGYTHVDPESLRQVLRDEGGASGMDPFVKVVGQDMEDEIKKTLAAMPDVGQHEDEDYILDDKGEIDVIKEDELEEKKKKKACKPSKGKRFAKRVDGKCRSFGQKGQAKGGGDRIRPGTKKGDAYCARSAKIKKCKNPPCANALSRKKWKCRGSKSMK